MPAASPSIAADDAAEAPPQRLTLLPGKIKALPPPPQRKITRRGSAGQVGVGTTLSSAPSERPNTSLLKNSISAGTGLLASEGSPNAVPRRVASRSKSISGTTQTGDDVASAQQTELQRKIAVLQEQAATTRTILSALTIDDSAPECPETQKTRDKLAMQEAMLDALLTTAAMEQLKEYEGVLKMQIYDNISDALYALETTSKKLASSSPVKTEFSTSPDDVLFEGFRHMRFELKSGTLNYCDLEQDGLVGSLELTEVTRIIKAQLDARIIILHGRQVMILASPTKKDTMLWVSSFVAVNESIAVVDAAAVRKELRMKRGSSGNSRSNRESMRQSDAMVPGCTRVDFIPLASLFSQQLAVEFKSNRVILEAGTLHDCCIWILLLGSSWDRAVLFQNYDRFTSPLALREMLEQCSTEIESQFGSDVQLCKTYRSHLAAVARHWLSEVFITDDTQKEREQRLLFRQFCLERLGSSHGLTCADPNLTAMAPRTSLGWFSMTAFVELSPEGMAGQLAIADYRLFAASGPQDFVNNSWNSSIDGGLKNIIKLSNIISSIVSFVILSAPDKKGRERAYLKWITVAHKLHAWYCCNTALSVLAGLSRTAIARLKIHEAIPSKSKARYDKLQSFYSPAKNFSEYRTLVTAEPPAAGSQPFLPVIAVLLKDLTFIEDGNTDFVGETSEPVLNWFKIHSISVQVHHVVRAREVVIAAKPNEELLAGILSFHPPTDDDLYEMSVKVLPIKVSLASLESKVSTLSVQNKHLGEEVDELKELRDRLKALLETTSDPAQAVTKSLALIEEQMSR